MCPHCQATVADTALYCDQCGNAVRVEPGFPRFVDGGKQFATSAAGQTLQAEQLLTQAKSAFGALLAVGLLTILCGGILFAAADSLNPAQSQIEPGASRAILLITGVLGSIFIACAFWARKQPLPASITGITIYITIELIGAIQNPALVIQGWPFKIIIIAILVRAIQAGLMHRRLSARMEAGDRERTV